MIGPEPPQPRGPLRTCCGATVAGPQRLPCGGLDERTARPRPASGCGRAAAGGPAGRRPCGPVGAGVRGLPVLTTWSAPGRLAWRRPQRSTRSSRRATATATASLWRASSAHGRPVTAMPWPVRLSPDAAKTAAELPALAVEMLRDVMDIAGRAPWTWPLTDSGDIEDEDVRAAAGQLTAVYWSNRARGRLYVISTPRPPRGGRTPRGRTARPGRPSGRCTRRPNRAAGGPAVPPADPVPPSPAIAARRSRNHPSGSTPQSSTTFFANADPPRSGSVLRPGAPLAGVHTQRATDLRLGRVTSGRDSPSAPLTSRFCDLAASSRRRPKKSWSAVSGSGGPAVCRSRRPWCAPPQRMDRQKELGLWLGLNCWGRAGR